MRIREATAADVKTLVSLNRCVQTMHADAFPERFRRNAPDQVVGDAFGTMIEAPSSFWLVAEEDQPIGFLSAEFRQRDETWFMISHRVCYLGGIVVAPHFRRRGVARALLAALKREANARGVAQIELDVWSFNGEAKEAFIKLGFQPMMEKMSISVELRNDE